MAYACWRQTGVFSITLGSDYFVTLAEIVSLKNNSNCMSKACTGIYATYLSAFIYR